ncbi:MAG: hypothetical protein ACJAYU_000172 [Bradymonadia bacterium]
MLFALLVACGGPQDQVTSGSAFIVLHGAQDRSRVRIDGVERVTVGRTNGAYLIQAGHRRLEVSTERHLPFLLDLVLRAGETYDVRVQLWPCFPELDDGCWEEPEGVLEQLPSGSL